MQQNLVKMLSNELSIFYVTTNTIQNAEMILSKLLENKLIACGTIIGQNSQVKSMYCWEGKINSDQEILLMLKSRTNLAEEIFKMVKENHPYQVPEFIAVDLKMGSQDYIDWVLSNTKSKQ